MKKLAITLVIVLGLLVAADFGAAATAEYQVSKKMRTELKLNEDPDVRISGFPFLSQAVAGDFRDVQLAARSVPVGQLHELGVEATLHDARVSTADVLSGKADHVDVDRVDGRVKLKSSDVGRVIGINDLAINPAPKKALEDAGDSASGDTGSDADSGGSTPPGSTVDRSKTTVALDGTVNIADEKVQVKTIAVLSLLNGQLKIEPRKLDVTTGTYGKIPLPEFFQRSVLQQFTTTLDPGMLPFRITPTAVRAEHGALVVEGNANNVTVGSGGFSTR